jgi:hypothetical protein
MLDATVLIAGIGWPRWSYEVLRHGLWGDFQVVLSPTVIEQARRRLARLLPGQVAVFDRWLETSAVELVPDPTPKAVAAHLTLVRQVDDVPVALAAIAAQVDYFVSEDKDFTDTAGQSPRLHQQLTILRPVIFLREVMGWSSEALEQIRYRDWDDLPPVAG